MGWGELVGWTQQARRSRGRQGGMTDPDSWDGRESDPWWDQQRERGRPMGG